MNLNRVTIAGNLTRDVEMRFLNNGNAVGSFGMALNRKWKDQQSGQMKEEVCFCDLTIFGKRAEALAQYCRKGSPLYVEARLKTDSWEDKTTGQKRSKMILVVEDFQFLGGKRDATSPAATAATPPAGSAAVSTDPLDPNDSVPF
jgi:single-strand DNA-binding protein